MTRLGLAGSMTAFLLASAAPAFAGAGDDTVAEVMRDCGGNSLPRDQVSTCLERARVLDQSEPSAQLQSLEAQLEQRVKGGYGNDDEAGPPPPPPTYGPDNGPSDDQMGPDDQGPPDEDSGPDDQGPPPQGYGPDDRGPPNAGPSDEDEPPVDDGEDGYDNSQPDQGYDAPDAPDDEDQGPPPPDDEDQG